MDFSVIWTRKSLKYLEKIPKPDAGRIIESVDSIRTDPFRAVERLAGSDWYRYRVGEYRVIMDIQRNTVIIFVLKVGARKIVYRNL